MPELAFIYPRSFQKAQLISLVIFLLTISTLCYLLSTSPNRLFALVIAAVLIACVGFYISFLISQQALSFTLSQTHIQHHCNKGGWSLAWQQIHSIAIPTISHDNWHQELPWVGLRLNNYESLLNSISFRVASQILNQQRPLLLIGFRYAEHPTHPLEDMLFDDKVYIANSGKIYRGLLAMLANRMSYTRELLGFDLFIDQNLLDREPQDFVGTLRRYLSAYKK